MQILPVLDLLDGQVVRGVAGHRENYRPVQSRLADSASPLNVAMAFRQQLQLNQLYVADLDAIEGRRSQIAIWCDLVENGFDVEIDMGVRSTGELQAAFDSGVHSAIIASESLPSLELLTKFQEVAKPERLVFSLDLLSGKPRVQIDEWASLSALEIVKQVAMLGIHRFIVLDVRSVGMENGTGTEELCHEIRNLFPHIELTTGGGIRSVADIHRQKEFGSNRVLVASALHSGTLTERDIRCFSLGNRGNPGAC